MEVDRRDALAWCIATFTSDEEFTKEWQEEMAEEVALRGGYYASSWTESDDEGSDASWFEDGVKCESDISRERSGIGLGCGLWRRMKSRKSEKAGKGAGSDWGVEGEKGLERLSVEGELQAVMEADRRAALNLIIATFTSDEELTGAIWERGEGGGGGVYGCPSLSGV